MTGYDFDGTLQVPNRLLLKLAVFVGTRFKNWKFYRAVQERARLRFMPEPGSMVVTARNAHGVKLAQAWLLKHGIDIPVLGREGGHNVADICAHKASAIITYGITKFYEDDPEQVKYLRDHCPGCEVIRV